MLHALNARVRDDREAGFTLIEILVAMVLMAIIMTSVAVFFVGAQKTSSSQRLRQDAAVLADQAMDHVHSVKISNLVTNRDKSSSDAQWLAPVTGVDLSTMTELYDTTTVPAPPAGTGTSSGNAALPTVPQVTSLNGNSFNVSYYVGTCYIPVGGGNCIKVVVPPVPTNMIAMDRVIVAVTWKALGSGCSQPTNICSYVVASLISPAGDPTFNVNQTLVDTTPPSTPSSLGCTTASGQAGDQQIGSFTWALSSDASGVSHYTLWRGTQTNFASVTSPWVNVTTLTAPSGSFVDTGLVPATTYWYVVTATDNVGNTTGPQVPPGTVTNPQQPFMVSCTTKPDIYPPSGLTVTAGPTAPTMTTTTISFSATDDYKMGTYQIFRNGGTTPIGTVAAPATTFTDTGLSPWSTYTYQVKAIDLYGNASPLAPSTPVSIKTTDTSPPSQPVSLTATLSATVPTEIDLDWANSTDNVSVVGYRVYRSTPTAGTMALLASPTTSNYSDTGLASNTKYYYTVYAVDEANNLSLVSATVNASTPDSIPPSAPTGLNAPSRTATTMNLAWTASTDNIGVVGYYIYRNGGTTPVGNVAGTTFTDTGLTSYTAYTYTVKAYDAAGNISAASSSLNVTTADGTPPSTVALTSSGYTYTSATLSWGPATDNVGVTGYAIFRNGGSTPIGTTPVGTTTYTDATLSPGTAYTYTVEAYDAAGNYAAPSNVVSLTTTTDSIAPSKVLTVHGVQAAVRSLRLTWAASTDNVAVAGYKVYFGSTLEAVVPSPTLTATIAVANSTTNSVYVYAYDTSGNLSPASTVDTCTVNSSGNVSCTT